MAYKGKFSPKNPGKYQGDPHGIVYRSGLERSVMSYLDNHPDVLEWASEELSIPYESPLDGRVHRYFPDLLVRSRLPDGSSEVYLAEVKPAKECVPPEIVEKGVGNLRARRRFLKAVRVWGVNSAKWAAAERFCERKGWRFVKITEADIARMR